MLAILFLEPSLHDTKYYMRAIIIMLTNQYSIRVIIIINVIKFLHATLTFHSSNSLHLHNIKTIFVCVLILRQASKVFESLKQYVYIHYPAGWLDAANLNELAALCHGIKR